MASIFRITITIGKGDAARERTVSIDPDEIPMGVLEDLESLGDVKKWKDVRPIICGLLDLTTEEYRAMTRAQFAQIAQALNGAVNEATAIPNDGI